MFFNWIAAILFIVGVIAVALGITYFPMKELLLAGIIIAGVGVLFSNLFRES